MEISKKLKGSFLSAYKIIRPYLKNQKPQTIEVHPSYPCNYSCQWCIDRELKELGVNKDCKSMSTEEDILKIINFCKKREVKGIIISGGGEPTLNKNTELLVKLANEANIVIGMFTNGSMLNDDNIPIYIDNSSFIRFSFDDFKPKNYSKTKGVPERFYHKVINNIRDCVAYKRKSGNSKCRIGIDFILIPENIPRMYNAYRFVNLLKVDYIQFCDCVIIGYEFTNLRKRLIKENLDRILETHRHLKSSMDVVYEPIQMENYFQCRDCKVKDYIFQIGADGQVRPCPHLARHDELSYGDIREKDLEEIWDNRPKNLDTDLLYENCRFRRQNELLYGLSHITHGEMI